MRLVFLFDFPPHFVFFPFTLFTLRGISPSSSASSHGKDEYLFQRQEQRGAARGQKHPSIRPPSLPLPRDLCCLDASEWRSSCGWLRAKHAAAALPQQFKQYRAALLSLCVQLCGPTASTVTCSKLILWLPRVHASAWNAYQSVGFDVIWEHVAAAYNSVPVIDADPKKDIIIEPQNVTPTKVLETVQRDFYRILHWNK